MLILQFVSGGCAVQGTLLPAAGWNDFASLAAAPAIAYYHSGAGVPGISGFDSSVVWTEASARPLCAECFANLGGC